MSNLVNLYQTDLAFRDIVTEAAMKAIGSTSAEFAEEWLLNDGKAGENVVTADVDGSNATNQPLADVDSVTVPKTAQETRETAQVFNAPIDAGVASLMGVHAHEVECYKKQIAELQAKVDELTAENAKLSADELYYRDAYNTVLAQLEDYRARLGKVMDVSNELWRVCGLPVEGGE